MNKTSVLRDTTIKHNITFCQPTYFQDASEVESDGMESTVSASASEVDDSAPEVDNSVSEVDDSASEMDDSASDVESEVEASPPRVSKSSRPKVRYLSVYFTHVIFCPKVAQIAPKLDKFRTSVHFCSLS